MLSPNEHSTLLQRLPNVVQTLWTFGQRWVDVVLTLRVTGIKKKFNKQKIIFQSTLAQIMLCLC